jgi:hypothetical protein
VIKGDGAWNQERRLEEQKFAWERKQSPVHAYPCQDVRARRWGRASGKVDDPAQQKEKSVGNESDAAELVETAVLTCNGETLRWRCPSARKHPPNDRLISCKRLVKTYGHYLRAEAWTGAEPCCARGCRLHWRVRRLTAGTPRRRPVCGP